MAEPEEEPEELSWHQLLSFNNPIFKKLRASKNIEKDKMNLMCEIRGDLFVWCNRRKAMLTTHLKRIVAKPTNPQVFQVLFSFCCYIYSPTAANTADHTLRCEMVYSYLCPLPEASVHPSTRNGCCKMSSQPFRQAHCPPV